jgi:hypothetical protein
METIHQVALPGKQVLNAGALPDIFRQAGAHIYGERRKVSTT